MEKGVGEMPVEKEEGHEEEKEERVKGAKPDFRVLQPQVDKEGKQCLADVGALWKNVSKSGNEFYTLKIGKLRLLVFENRDRE
ncbi:hypothetical protein J4441_01010 [Candidatus Micrarchaeota archaeon]|nr:hypothetical protein [Candidatus Micrarchaeota archaeon]